MRDNSVLIICICIIICTVIIAATAIIVLDNHDENNNTNQNTTQATVTNNNSSSNSGGNSASSSSSSSTQSASSSDIGPGYPSSVTFYSDGNPNTGETATLNFGTNAAGKTIKVRIFYYRDSEKLSGNYEFQTVTIGQDGTVKITDNTPMSKYPDTAEIQIEPGDGNRLSSNYDLGTYSGSQTCTPRYA